MGDVLPQEIQRQRVVKLHTLAYVDDVQLTLR